MTSSRSRFLHKLAREQGAWEVYEEYLKSNDSDAPVTIRQLLSLKKVDTTTSLEAVQPRADILKLFGSGAMSFGAIRESVLLHRRHNGLYKAGRVRKVRCDG